MKKYLVAALFAPLSLCFADDNQAVYKYIQGIVLTGGSQELNERAVCEISGVKFIDLTPPASAKKLKRDLLALIAPDEISSHTLDKIEARVRKYYIDSGHPFVVVKIPEQDMYCKVLRVEVVESHVGEIAVEGNRWVPKKRILNFLDVKEGEEIDTSQLLRNLNFINANTFMQADVIFAAGKEQYTTDLTVAVKTRRQLQVYAGSDNTGIKAVSPYRWFVGANWGNVFGLGHILNAQYSAAFHIHRFQAVNVNYTAPLSWHHLLNIYGGYTEVHPKINIPHMKNHGWSYQTSLRYEIPLWSYRRLQHNILFGGDYKRTNNTFEFSETGARVGHNVNLTQFALEYNGNYHADSAQLDFDGSLFYSPGSWLGDQSNSDYRTLRRGAKHTWVYFRGGLSYLQKLPKNFSLYLLTRGQVSSQNLLPSEQYGIGGYDTVRGYEQRQLNKDSAALATFEARAPYFAIFKRNSSPRKDGLQFRAFIDWGWGTDHKAEIPGHKTGYLLGAGPGLTYFYDRYLSVRFDLGFKVHHEHYRGGSPMVHFSVIGNY